MTGTALNTNEILQWYMQDLVLNKIVIAFIAKNLIKFLLISTWISLKDMRIGDVFAKLFWFGILY